MFASLNPGLRAALGATLGQLGARCRGTCLPVSLGKPFQNVATPLQARSQLRTATRPAADRSALARHSGVTGASRFSIRTSGTSMSPTTETTGSI